MVHRRSFKVVSAIFALTLLAAACGGGDDDDGEGIETDEGGVSAGTEDTVEVQEGGTVVLAGEQEPTGLNWLQAEDNAAWTNRVMQLVLAGGFLAAARRDVANRGAVRHLRGDQ